MSAATAPTASQPVYRARIMRRLTFVLALALVSCATEEGPPAPPVRTEEADLSEELTGGSGPALASAMGLTVPDGYVMNEHVAAGIATDYLPVGTLTSDGRWTFEPNTTAEYRTRVLVRRPEDPAEASGIVVVEWLNVTSGSDTDPDFAYLVEEIVRRGHVWVGVSAQLMGIEGGDALFAPGGEAPGLRALDPARYGSLTHPGDGYSFDIFTQVARALANGSEVLGGITPRALLAMGESQSAFALTTYYDGVQPLEEVFDGFFVHSRAAGFLPLVRPHAAASLTAALGSPVRPIFRDDLDAPVLSLQAEGDLTGYLASLGARQADGATFRLWEVAGTAHADAHLLGAFADTFDCGVAINDGPMHVVAKAAFRALETWVVSGTAPPMAPRLEIDETGEDPAVARDADAIALGGVRSPPVDVPLDLLSGETASSSIECVLFGSTIPLSEARIAELYTSAAEYEAAYAEATDATIAAGFALEEDREALVAYSDSSRVGP